jgi:hypothetical protein
MTMLRGPRSHAQRALFMRFMIVVTLCTMVSSVPWFQPIRVLDVAATLAVIEYHHGALSDVNDESGH